MGREEARRDIMRYLWLSVWVKQDCSDEAEGETSVATECSRAQLSQCQQSGLSLSVCVEYIVVAFFQDDCTREVLITR